MCSIPPLRPYKTQKHNTATSRCPATVVLAAAFGLVFLANGALAQVQESTAPIISSGVRGSTPGQISVTAEPSQWSATQLPPASQPPIESIGPGSEIRSFLAPGVPQDAAREALRRAWVADPAIRTYIGPSENSWDFNAPDGVPGFGSPISTEADRVLTKEAEHRPLSSSDIRETDRNTSGR
jgi:hypothetical protein